MPTDPALVDPKDEIQPEQCEEAGATWEPIDPQETQPASTLRWVGLYAGI